VSADGSLFAITDADTADTDTEIIMAIGMKK
jgi:hypothetical protein